MGFSSIRFRGWETASGRNATGETAVSIDNRQSEQVEVTARLEVADFATCQQDGGYVCTFDSGDPSNIARSSIIDCPDCKYTVHSRCVWPNNTARVMYHY